MKKFTALLLIVLSFSSWILPVEAALRDGGDVYSPINYPEGEDFSRLKQIIDDTFIVQSRISNKNCIVWGWLCPNYKYTSLSEKTLKYITLKTYKGNEDFYSQLFPQVYPSQFDWRARASSSQLSFRTPSFDSWELQIWEILSHIPEGTPVNNFLSTLFDDYFWWNIPESLIESSFGIDFTENANTHSMLGAIDLKIQELKLRKCRKENGGIDTSKKCAVWNDLSNHYLPTRDELLGEMIFLNGASVKIDSIQDEFEYTISGSIDVYTKIIYPKLPELELLYKKIEDEQKEIESKGGILWAWTASIANSLYSQQKQINNYLSFESVKNGLESIERQSSSDFTSSERDLILAIRDELNYFQSELERKELNITYTLSYKKDTFTLEEAKDTLEKKLLFSEIQNESDCVKTDIFPTLIQCQTAIRARQKIQFAAETQYQDTGKYPASAEEIKDVYIGTPNARTDFNMYFSYKGILPSDGGPPMSEITLKKDIGTWIINPKGSDYIDYTRLLSWATLPLIPAVFAHIPKESMVLYIKNPQNILAILDTKSDTISRISGVDTSVEIKKLLKKFFEVQDFTILEKNLKHEVVFLVDNLDLTAPDITMILSKDDKAAFTPREEPRFTHSKDGFIFIANSQVNLDRLINLTKKDSLSEAPDFQYVWWKKSSLLKDAFFFVGDAFFEKMLSFESYILHFRKYRDVRRLSLIQELSWSYQDAFGKNAETLDILLENMSGSKILQENTARYTIADGVIVDPKIGTLGNIKTLRENNYDLSKIARSEIDDYRYNVRKYRDIWRASLDPMGIILNRYWDGIEIDFFMSPIPSLPQTDLSEIQKIFEWVTKDSLNFLTNPRLRIGIFSFIVGFDPKKFEKKSLSNTDSNMSKDIRDMNKEILDGKNIFDYIGGELWFSLGNLAEDIFDGWNIEKIDAYISLQVASEEKGKELIEIIRKKILNESKKNTSSWLADIQSFLTKPLIEDYKWKKIYYTENISLPFIGKVWFAYTFVDDFFFLAPNRMTVHRIVDIAESGDIRKTAILDKNTASKGSFLALIFDGESVSKDFKGIYEKNTSILPKYLSSFERWVNSGVVNSLLSRYYASFIQRKKLNLPSIPMEYRIWGFSLLSKDDDIHISLDQKKYQNLSGSRLKVWEGLDIVNKYSKEIFTKEGISVDPFLKDNPLWNIFSLAFMVHLDDVLRHSESLFQNNVFSLNMGENEIGFTLHTFRNMSKPPRSNGVRLIEGTPTELSSDYNDIILIGVVLSALSLLSWVTLFFWKKRRKTLLSSLSWVSPWGKPVPIVDNSASIIIVNSSLPSQVSDDATISSEWKTFLEWEILRDTSTPLSSPVISTDSPSPVALSWDTWALWELQWSLEVAPLTPVSDKSTDSSPTSP